MGSHIASRKADEMVDRPKPEILHLDSQYVEAPTEVEVLVPDEIVPGRRYRVVYILPVSPGREGRWGSGMREASNLDAANRHGVICVGPTFPRHPWYADHPGNPRLREESYVLRDVVPLVDERYPTEASPHGRLLLGFSKSGWGAFTLLLRNPDVFGRAVAWDAPLDMRQLPEGWGLEEHFGDAAHFARHRILDLLRQRADLLREQPPRLGLLNSPDLGFAGQMMALHEAMDTLGIPHLWKTSAASSHDWSSGWFPEALQCLMEMDTPTPDCPS